jgi:hypothetical protein
METTVSKPTTPQDAARIQSAASKANAGKTPPNSHASRAQAAAAKPQNQPGDKKGK